LFRPVLPHFVNGSDVCFGLISGFGERRTRGGTSFRVRLLKFISRNICIKSYSPHKGLTQKMVSTGMRL